MPTNDEWLGNSLASLWDIPQDVPQYALPLPQQDAPYQQPQFAPPIQPPRYVLPQVDINSLIPNAPPQISGNVTVPTPLGELFASGKYQPMPQRPEPPEVHFGYRRRF